MTKIEFFNRREPHFLFFFFLLVEGFEGEREKENQFNRVGKAHRQ